MKKGYAVACAMLLSCGISVQAQSLNDVLSKAVDTAREITGTAVVKDITGTWNYSGAAVSFESDNLLQKAGGVAAASAVEKKLDEQLSRVGIKPGATTFTFNEDATFSCLAGGRTIRGTYTYDSSASKLSMKFGSFISASAAVTGSSESMSLLFDADKLLVIVTAIGGKINNSTIEAITSIASSYDGMKLGLEVRR